MDVAYKFVHQKYIIKVLYSEIYFFTFIYYLNDFEFDYLSVFSMIRYALGSDHWRWSLLDVDFLFSFIWLLVFTVWFLRKCKKLWNLRLGTCFLDLGSCFFGFQFLLFFLRILKLINYLILDVVIFKCQYNYFYYYSRSHIDFFHLWVNNRD